MFLEVSIANPQKAPVGFSLAFVQKTGPIVRLTDAKTQAEAYVKTNLADLDLQKNLTLIRPGKSVIVEWVITARELEQFGGTEVDVFAEVIIKAVIEVEGKPMGFLGSAMLRIVSKAKS